MRRVRDMWENILTRLTYSTDLQECVFFMAIILISVVLIAL
jgi:hypothetical protein